MNAEIDRRVGQLGGGGVTQARRSSVLAGDRRLVAYVVQDPDWKGPENEGDEGPDPAAEQVSQWQAVYDHAYGANADEEGDPTFNIVSWDSSYTNRPLPAEEMRVWVESTGERDSRAAGRW
ncbi:MAG: hypothetical protein ABFS02_04715, partial [Pseudomonadota bacterium]